MTYLANVHREEGMWLGEVPGLPGAHAYARTLARLREELADAIILSNDLDDDAHIEITFTLADSDEADVVPLITQAFDLAATRRQLREATNRLAEETARVALQLIGKGVSVRDAAGALDMTPGRISQIVAPDKPAPTKAAPAKSAPAKVAKHVPAMKKKVIPVKAAAKRSRTRHARTVVIAAPKKAAVKRSSKTTH